MIVVAFMLFGNARFEQFSGLVLLVRALCPLWTTSRRKPLLAFALDAKHRA